MSLCDTCKDPGHCCRGIPLHLAGGRFPIIEIIVAVAEADLPFEPDYIDGEWGMRWSCRNLQPDGRCGDYENRPQLCHDFQPAQDPLCCHHKPTAPGCQGHGTDDLIKIWSKEISS